MFRTTARIGLLGTCLVAGATTAAPPVVRPDEGYEPPPVARDYHRPAETTARSSSYGPPAPAFPPRREETADERGPVWEWWEWLRAAAGGRLTIPLGTVEVPDGGR